MVYYLEFYIQEHWRLPDGPETSYVFVGEGSLGRALAAVPIVAAKFDLSIHNIRVRRNK